MILDAKAARKGDALQDSDGAGRMEFEHRLADLAAKMMVVTAPSDLEAGALTRKMHRDDVSRLFHRVEIAVDRCQTETRLR